MRLLFCINRDIHTNVALNHILAKSQPSDEHFVFFSERLGPKRLPSQALEFMRFYEQDLLNQYLFPLYESLPTGENRLLTFNQLSNAYRMPINSIRNINSPESVQAIQELNPDLIISIRFGQIFREPIIQIPKHGVINLHSGLLPSYRGVFATFWSLLNGDTEHGYTLHCISDSSIDTGAMIARKAFPIDPAQSVFWHISSLYPAGAESIVQAIEAVRNGEQFSVVPQSEAESRYYGLPTAEDFARFQEKGFKQFDETFYYQLLGQFCDSSALPDGAHTASRLTAFNNTVIGSV